MFGIDRAVRQALTRFIPEDLGVDLVSAKAVTSIDVRKKDRVLALTVILGYPCSSVQETLRQQIEAALAPCLKGLTLALDLQVQIKPHRAQHDMPSMSRVANVIAVASGKGGVGKSTTAVNLALALQAEGARVGLLDADIFGPSQPIMLGIPDGTRPEMLEDQVLVPVMAHGLQTMSMGYLATRNTAVVWRGPKASGALTQLMQQTAWKELDYLIVDLPPGTSDIQLTLAQKIPVAGAVIVTTPQDIALLDAIKGVEMFRKVDVRVLGIVENMAVHICSNCGHEEHVFGEGGGESMSKRYEVPLLGSLPLSLRIREQADGGKPTVLADPDSAEALLYRKAARRLAAQLSLTSEGRRAFPRVVQQQ